MTPYPHHDPRPLGHTAALACVALLIAAAVSPGSISAHSPMQAGDAFGAKSDFPSTHNVVGSKMYMRVDHLSFSNQSNDAQHVLILEQHLNDPYFGGGGGARGTAGALAPGRVTTDSNMKHVAGWFNERGSMLQSFCWLPEAKGMTSVRLTSEVGVAPGAELKVGLWLKKRDACKVMHNCQPPAQQYEWDCVVEDGVHDSPNLPNIGLGWQEFTVDASQLRTIWQLRDGYYTTDTSTGDFDVHLYEHKYFYFTPLGSQEISPECGARPCSFPPTHWPKPAEWETWAMESYEELPLDPLRHPELYSEDRWPPDAEPPVGDPAWDVCSGHVAGTPCQGDCDCVGESGWRLRAVEYSDDHAEDPNPCYGPPFPGDCTSFVSQSLYKGGFNMVHPDLIFYECPPPELGWYLWYMFSREDYARPWAVTFDLYYHLEERGRVEWMSEIDKQYQVDGAYVTPLRRGDILFYDWPEDSETINHAAFLAALNGWHKDDPNTGYQGDLVNYHTANTHHGLWNVLPQWIENGESIASWRRVNVLGVRIRYNDCSDDLERECPPPPPP